MTDGRLFSVGVTVDDDRNEWYTPRWLFDALGLTYDLDVASPADRTLTAVPAHRYYTPDDDGLTAEWSGLVWCNPPYSDAGGWAYRMIAHGNGLLLTHVPMNAAWALDVWRNADGVALFQGMHFVRPDATTQRPAWWLQLAAFGPTAYDALVGLPARLPHDLDDRWHPGPVWTAAQKGPTA
jgi:hypothetical protein